MAKTPTQTVAFLSTAPERCWKTGGATPRQTPLEEMGRSGCVVAALDEREFVFHQFEMQRDLTAEQLAESVEIKMFQDAGLNPMLEYKNAFCRRPSRQDSRINFVNAVAASMGALEGATAAVREESAYIDAVVPLTTLPYALYNAEILEKKRDVFIYFQKDALQIALFDEGEFVYGKAQDYGIRKLLDEYVALSRDRMEYADFVQLLMTAKPKSQDPEQIAQSLGDLREVISTALAGVKNILLYAGRISGVGEYDRVFVGTCEGLIPGVEELAQEILEIEAHEFIFYTSFYMQGEPYIDQFAVLALLEGQNLQAGLKANPFNVTPYRRPGAFLKRPGGKLVLWAAASLLAAVLWPGFYGLQTLWLEYQTQKGLQSLGKSRMEFEALQDRRSALAQEREKLEKQLAQTEKTFEESVALLKSVHDKRLLSSPVTTGLANLFAELSRSGVYVQTLTLEGRKVELALSASKDTQITGLLENLVVRRYAPELSRIERQESSRRFITQLKVVLP
ncbi:MAG: hypothetical protein AB7E49_03160 [Campylobacterales bacterium]